MIEQVRERLKAGETIKVEGGLDGRPFDIKGGYKYGLVYFSIYKYGSKRPDKNWTRTLLAQDIVQAFEGMKERDDSPNLSGIVCNECSSVLTTFETSTYSIGWHYSGDMYCLKCRHCPDDCRRHLSGKPCALKGPQNDEEKGTAWGKEWLTKHGLI